MTTMPHRQGASKYLMILELPTAKNRIQIVMFQTRHNVELTSFRQDILSDFQIIDESRLFCGYKCTFYVHRLGYDYSLDFRRLSVRKIRLRQNTLAPVVLRH
jgi:hypothetical protein